MSISPPPPVEEEGWLPPIPDAIDLVVESQAILSAHAAQQYWRVEQLRRDALADAARHGYRLSAVIERGIRLELACALRVTEHAAGMLLADADALVNRYPTVLDALGTARITPRHATLLVEALDGVEPEYRDELLQPALHLAQTLPVGTFRRTLRTLIETVRAATLTQRHEAALTRRRVVVEPADDGMGWLHWYAPLVQVRAGYDRLTAQGTALTGRDEDTRTLDQARADITGDLLVCGDTSRLPAAARRIRATVTVTVPALTLLTGDTRHGVPSMEGVGPIPLDTARELCGGAKTWMRVLTHPETGIVLSLGRTKYRPTADLKRAVRWRSDTCAAPGCGIPAHRCDIDHNLAWDHGGATAIWNHAPLCQGHHTVRHDTQWRIRQPPDSGGIIRWTSPSGRTYTTRPERRTPTLTPKLPHTGSDDDPPPF